MLQGEPNGKPINKVLPSAQGRLLRVWQDRDRRYIVRFLTWKQERKFYGSAVRVVQEQVLYLSAGGSSNRKEGTEGQKEVRKTTRAANSGPCPKAGMGDVHLVVHKHFSSMVEHLSPKRKVPDRLRQMQPKSVRLQERKSTYCSVI